MSLLEKAEVRDLLIAARATRNYCMLTGRGRENSDQLIDALAPFDGNPNQIKLTHLVALRKSMRDVCRDIDDYTLTRILDGEPPVRIGSPTAKVNRAEPMDADASGAFRWFRNIWRFGRKTWPSVWQRIVLPGLAVILLLLAMHYTHWSFNASLLLTRLEEHNATDVHEEVRDLIVVARAIETNKQDELAVGTSTPAQKLFNQMMNRLTAFHYREEALRQESLASVERFNALNAARDFVVRIPDILFQPSEDDDLFPEEPSSTDFFAENAPDIVEVSAQKGDALAEQTVAEAANVISDVEKIEGDTAERSEDVLSAEKALVVVDATSAVQDQTGPHDPVEPRNFDLVQNALISNDGFQDIVQVIAEKTGRNPITNSGSHVVTRLELVKTASEVKDNISIANRFALPMIYGSLGAALFCLVRVLTPALSDLGPARAFLRILFGAFAAMTLSMLFIPANVFSINEQSNPTLIFLACFLFGYSFDAVLSALHRLEAFLQGRLQPQNSGGNS